MSGLHEGRRFCAGLLALTGLSTKTASEVTSFLPVATCTYDSVCACANEKFSSRVPTVFCRLLDGLVNIRF